MNLAAANTHDGYGSISHGSRLLSKLYAFQKAKQSPEELPMLPQIHTEHERHAAAAGAELSWSGLSVETVGQKRSSPSRVLLNDVRGTVQPGQILAVMGTSGAGKTTLLNALAGYSNRRQVSVRGTVRIDGVATNAEERTSTNVIGYVEQVEPFFGRITPREHLLFEGMLRMPSSIFTDDERRVLIEDTISLFHLEECASTNISNLSGGERKRLALATVALINPAIMLIDEPTSGLDSYLAKSIMTVIRMLAVEQRRSIVVVLHQPSAEMFTYIDLVCVLVPGGRQAFFGDTQREASLFFGETCQLKSTSLDGYIQELCSSKVIGHIVADVFTIMSPSIPTENARKTLPIAKVSLGQANFGRQIKWLLWRSWRSEIRSPVRTSKLGIRLIIMALIFGAIFFRLNPLKDNYVQNLRAVCLNMTMPLIVPCMSIVAISTLNERARLIRDRQRGTYSIGAYYVTKLILDSIFVIVVTVVYMSFIVWLINLKHWALTLVTVSLQILAACGTISLLVACVSSILMVLLLLQSLVMILTQFSGYFIHLRSIPIYLDWFKYISLHYYAYPALLQLQLNGQANVARPCNIEAMATEICYTNGTTVLHEYHLDRHSVAFSLTMLAVLTLGFHGLSFLLTVVRVRRAI